MKKFFSIRRTFIVVVAVALLICYVCVYQTGKRVLREQCAKRALLEASIGEIRFCTGKYEYRNTEADIYEDAEIGWRPVWIDQIIGKEWFNSTTLVHVVIYEAPMNDVEKRFEIFFNLLEFFPHLEELGIVYYKQHHTRPNYVCSQQSLDKIASLSRLRRLGISKRLFGD